MNELALFAGAGGGILGTFLLGWRVVCAVEINPYCREVLLRRQEEGILPPFPIWDDIRTFDGKLWRGKVDVVTAGFPCQPWSVAGQQRGELDERNLWPDTIRIIGEVRPRYCLLENVPNLLTHQYFGTLLRDLATSGFDARWKVISAAEVGAPHKRDRVWIVANTTGNRLEGELRQDSIFKDGASKAFPTRNKKQIRNVDGHWWKLIPESEICRVADGVAYRVDRLKALGEGQVPAVVRAAWELLR